MNYLLLVLITSLSLGSGRELKHYNFEQPDKIISLPDSLREISGIAFINDSTVVCVQDENGILFVYDIQHNRIKERHPFHADGDYEGITTAYNYIYILRSDGKLFEISDFNSKKISTKSYTTNVPASNNEGLCFNYGENELLIGCKNKVTNSDVEKDVRQIYAFDLSEHKLDKNAKFEMRVEDAMTFADKKNLDMSGVGANKKGKNKNTFKFNISAIAIHPISGNLYILNAADHALFVVNDKSKIIAIQLLDPVLFNKPEGLTFKPNGDMFITNEGQEGNANIVSLTYH
ncbi:MAG TPA: hypothetical protein PLJ00_11755 [Chitinophagales bacterium]|nr:hypothetical protein [Chitinophagales bacterium]HRG28559.1 hypothetical protein [Chitinophagales bacterium]HRH52785.1 hypothetical protein [Chitinophagales bacterium]